MFSKYLASVIFAIVVLSRCCMVCVATAEIVSSHKVLYPVDTSVYKYNEKGIDEWIVGSISSFDPSSDAYEISWSDMTAEYIDAKTTDAFVHNEMSYDEYQFRRNEEDGESLIQEHYEENARVAIGVEDGESMSKIRRLYAVGTVVSIRNYDGTWTYGKIVRYEEGDYTVEWDHGERYVVSAEDDELDQMVENAISQSSIPSDEDIDYPSGMAEISESSGKAKESTFILFVIAGILVVVGYARHKKLVTLSSAKTSEGLVWGSNIKRGTSLSRQMDDNRNLRSTLSIM